MAENFGGSVRARPLWVALTAVLVAACGSSSTMDVRVHGSLQDSTDLAGILINVDDGFLTASSFQTSGGVANAEVDVPNSASFGIGAVLVDRGVAVADGSTTLEGQDDYAWALDVWRQVADPALLCMGCQGSLRIPIADSVANLPGEAIWLVWSGQPRGSDIVY